MKTRLLVALVLATSATALLGESPAVLLSNAENLELYYTIDPPGLVGPDTSSAVFVGKVVSFLSETTPVVPFSRLEPLGVQRVEGLSEGTHVLVGFFLLRGAAEIPVRVVRLQAGGGIEERLYTIYREPATVMAKAGRGRLVVADTADTSRASAAAPAPASEAAQAAPPAAAPAADDPTGFWRTVDPLVTFTGAFEPEIVVRQTAEGSRVIPFAAAAYWGVDGVRPREIRIVRRADEVAFRVRTFGAMSENESLFFYVQTDRASGADNRLTIEIAPTGDGEGGYVVLWRKSSPKPVIVGRFAQLGSIVLGRVRYADLGGLVDLSAALPQVTLDVCTGHYEPSRRVYEEYYHATIELDQVPVVDDEGTLFL